MAPQTPGECTRFRREAPASLSEPRTAYFSKIVRLRRSPESGLLASGASGAVARRTRARPDALQEAARPNELGRENGQADRNDDQCRPGQDDHRSTDQEHRATDHRDRDPPRALQQGVKTAAEAPALLSFHARSPFSTL